LCILRHFSNELAKRVSGYCPGILLGESEAIQENIKKWSGERKIEWEEECVESKRMRDKLDNIGKKLFCHFKIMSEEEWWYWNQSMDNRNKWNRLLGVVKNVFHNKTSKHISAPHSRII